MQTNRTMRNVISVLAACFAAVCTLSAIGVVCLCRDRTPVLLHVPEEAVRQVEDLMEAVCTGDFSKAETLLYGEPKLGLDQDPDQEVGRMIWDAYVNSLDYELIGSVYPSETGIVQDVKFISMELPAVTEHLGERARRILDETIASAEDVSELYNEENEYRQELIQEILRKAAGQALEEDVRYTYRIIPVQMIYRDNRWWAVADTEFLKAVSGGIMG